MLTIYCILRMWHSLFAVVFILTSLPHFVVELPTMHSRRGHNMFLHNTFFIGWFRPWPSRQRVSAVPQQIATKFAHGIGVVSGLKPYFRQFFPQLLKMVLNSGPSLRGVFCNLWRMWAIENWCAQICIFCPMAQNFLLVGPYFQHGHDSLYPERL